MECNKNGFCAAQILDRFYLAFIDAKTPTDFFVGMADYFQFADSIPSLEKVSAEILETPKPLRKKLAKLEVEALSDISKRKDELYAYTSKNKLTGPEITDAFQEYEGWENGKITGSPPKPMSMMLRLEDIVFTLHKMPEHREFASKYLVFSQDNTAVPKEPKSYEKYRSLYDELERGRDGALWGQLEQLSWLYDVVKRGTEQHRKLKERAERGDKEAEVEAFNYGFLLWEWKQLEDHNKWGTSGRSPTFFKIEKVRPWLVRLHLQFLASNVQQGEVSATEQQVEAKERPLTSTAGRRVPEKEPSVEGRTFFPSMGNPITVTQQEKALLELLINNQKKHTARAVEYGLVRRKALENAFGTKKAYEMVRERLLQKGTDRKHKIFDIFKSYEKANRTRIYGYQLIIYLPQKLRNIEEI